MGDFHNLLILMVVVWVAGKIFRQLHLPVIFGELLGGIIVGPALLGLVTPDSETIHVLAELGIFFLMFHAGLEADPDELLVASKKSFLIAIMGILVPFSILLALVLAFGNGIYESTFIAMGLSMTAIGITARLLKDNNIQSTATGHTILGAAVLGEIIALMIFSILFNIIETGFVDLQAVTIHIIKIITFFGIVIIGGFKGSKYFQPIFRNKGFTLSLILALGLGLIAEQIGLHLIMGAFLAGLFISGEVIDRETFNKIEDRIYGLSYSFLGPIFFTTLAFNLDFRAVLEAPYFILAVLVAAVFGKILGAAIGARIQKISCKKSATIGFAMNSRGEIDLIIASIGLQKGIIENDIFSVMIIVAFAATLFAAFTLKPFAKYAKSSFRIR